MSSNAMSKEALENTQNNGNSSANASNSDMEGTSKVWWKVWKKKGQQSVESTDSLEPVPYFSLFRFSTKREKLMIAVACISAFLHGAIFPFIIVVWGDAIDMFEGGTANLTSEVGKRSAIVMGFGGAAFLSSIFQVALQARTAQRQGIRIRKKYMRSLMRQDFTWYDRTENSTGELTARVAADVDLIQTGIGDKLTSVIQYLSMFLVSLIVAFVYSWKVTLVILSSTPILLISGTLLAKFTAEETTGSQKAYSMAGAVAQEVLSLIRTVSAFGGQESEIERYRAKLDSAYKKQVRQGHIAGVGLGFSNFVMFAVYGLSFWYGGLLVRRGEISLGDLFSAFFSMVEGAFGLGLAAPHFRAFGAARGAAPRTWEVIDRESEIDPLSSSGKILDNVQGHIVFENVSFSYAARPDNAVFDNMSIEFRPGTSTALVGPSGCGKSSAVRLIERFYDPSQGSVKLDGVDLRELNVRWLRSQIGFVSQMPTLFATTIKENIAFGAALDFVDGSDEKDWALKRQEVTDQQIIKAAKLANAHQFISKLPDGYDTMLGERGAKLSGGQKQRIAIARAVVRDPPILLLDEATSSLDARSEKVVQEALERAQHGRTVIVVAHRLSTVRNCTSICVIQDGVVLERGTHDDLLGIQDGRYRKLMELQSMQQTQTEKEERTTKGEYVEDEKDDPARPGLGLPKKQASSPHVSKSMETQDSMVVTEAVGGKIEDKLPDVDKKVLRRAFGMCISEWYYILFGIIGAGISGASWTVLALILSEASNEILMENRPSQVRLWSLMYVVIGAGSLLGTYVQYSLLAVSGERLSRRLRSRAFRALLRQEMGFFDRRENAVGALTTRLATEASSIKEVTGDSLGVVSFGVSTLAVGFVVSFTGCWRVALFVLALMPSIVLAGASQMKMVTGFDAGTKEKFAESGALASEALDNIRTVNSLGVQDIILQRYEEMMKAPLAYGRKAAWVSGLSFGVSEFLVPALWGGAFWLGARFVDDGKCSFVGLMKSVTGIVFGAMMIGNVFLRFPAVASARVAATRIFRLLDRESQIDPLSTEGVRVSSFSGALSVTDAKFEYPARPEVPVLRGLNIDVEPGKTLAICGASGCGKSTVVALIERFYDLRAGSIAVDEKDLRSLHLQSARSNMGLVAQEPDLFSRTVRENIAYGFSKEELTLVTDDQIVEAAKAADAHEFIMELEDNYDTNLGERGEQLSGGQRQRLSIARSLIRQPRILLLDEATSALDAASERAVQTTLDAARQGRTTIVVAHRLSTVKDADEIAVVKRGKIAERGTHAELMKKNGEYAKLVKYQLTAPPDKILPKEPTT